MIAVIFIVTKINLVLLTPIWVVYFQCHLFRTLIENFTVSDSEFMRLKTGVWRRDLIMLTIRNGNFTPVDRNIFISVVIVLIKCSFSCGFHLDDES